MNHLSGMDAMFLHIESPEMPMHIGHAATMTHLQMQLLQLRLLGRRGAILTQSDPEISQLLAWIWDESADQLHGRPPRPYRLREV